MHPVVEMPEEERNEWFREKLDVLSKTKRHHLFLELLNHAAVDKAFREWMTPEEPVMREKFKDLFKHKGKRGK